MGGGGNPPCDWNQALVHHYLRILIHLPALGSDAEVDAAASSADAVADAATHILQIIDLLEERHMSFSFAMNKNDLLVHSGLAILYHALDLDRNSKMARESERSIISVVDRLDRDGAPAAAEFRRLAHAVLARVPSAPSPPPKTAVVVPPTEPSPMRPAITPLRTTQSRLHSLASRIYRSSSRLSGAGGGTTTAKRKDHRLAPTSAGPPRSVPMDDGGGGGRGGRGGGGGGGSGGGGGGMGPSPMMHAPNVYSMRSSPAVPQLGRTMLPPSVPPRMRSHLDPPNLDHLSFATEPLSLNAELAATLEADHVGRLGEWPPLPPSFAPDPLGDYVDPGGTTTTPLTTPAAAGPVHTPFPTVAPFGVWRRPSLQPIPLQPSLTYSRDSMTSGGDDLSIGDLPSTCCPDDPYQTLVMPPAATTNNDHHHHHDNNNNNPTAAAATTTNHGNNHMITSMPSLSAEGFPYETDETGYPFVV